MKEPGMRQREHRSCWARRVIPLGVSQDSSGHTLLCRRRRPAGRKGALLSAELLFAFPVLAGLLLGIIEFGMLLAAEQRCLRFSFRRGCGRWSIEDKALPVPPGQRQCL